MAETLGHRLQAVVAEVKAPLLVDAREGIGLTGANLTLTRLLLAHGQFLEAPNVESYV